MCTREQYLDNGASHWVVTNNVASNASAAWAYFITGGNNKPAMNDHVDHFWCALSGVAVFVVVSIMGEDIHEQRCRREGSLSSPVVVDFRPDPTSWGALCLFRPRMRGVGRYQGTLAPYNNCTQFNCTVDESTVYQVMTGVQRLCAVCPHGCADAWMSDRGAGTHLAGDGAVA
jgi:hypothetical protein